MNYVKEVAAILAEVIEVPVDSITDFEQDLNETGELDSMKYLLFLSKLEEKFEVQFPEDDIFDLNSVNTFSKEIEKLKDNG